MLGFRAGASVLRLARVLIAACIVGAAAGCGGVTLERSTGASDAGPSGGTGNASGGVGGTGGRGGAPGGRGGVSGTGGSAGSGGATDICPSEGTDCPLLCNLMYAQQYYVPRNCLTLEAFPVGCTAIAEDGGAPECFKRVRDGALYVTTQLAAFRAHRAWTACTETERELVKTSCGITCPDGQVQTAEGCLGCAGVHDAVARRLEEAQAKMSACQTDADCACVPNATDCAGACEIAISADFAPDYASELQAASQSYCSDPGFRSVCGYSMPRCLPCTAVCTGGRCAHRATP
jgi:hypothetical protein